MGRREGGVRSITVVRAWHTHYMLYEETELRTRLTTRLHDSLTTWNTALSVRQIGPVVAVVWDHLVGHSMSDALSFMSLRHYFSFCCVEILTIGDSTRANATLAG